MILVFEGDLSLSSTWIMEAQQVLPRIIEAEETSLEVDLTRVTCLGLNGRNLLYWLMSQISAWSPIQLSVRVRDIPEHRILSLDPRLRANLLVKWVKHDSQADTLDG
jgi:hypothetical protein